MGLCDKFIFFSYFIIIPITLGGNNVKRGHFVVQTNTVVMKCLDAGSVSKIHCSGIFCVTLRSYLSKGVEMLSFVPIINETFSLKLSQFRRVKEQL